MKSSDKYSQDIDLARDWLTRNTENDFFGRHLSGSAKALKVFGVVVSALILGSLLSVGQVQDPNGTKPPEAQTRESTLRPFTVADSIGMTHFVDPPEHIKGIHPQISPDGERFFAVTERGLLEANVREYSLFIYAVKRASDSRHLVVTFRSASNRPGIIQPRWLDNDNVALVGENPGEVPQLYFVNCQTRKAQKITADPNGIAAYDVSRDRNKVAYYSLWGGNEAENKYKEDHGFAVSDESLGELITGLWKRPADVYRMYVMNVSTGRVQIVHAGPFHYIPGRLRVWLSPDGSYAVTEQDAVAVRPNWESYEDRLVKRVAHEEEGQRYQIRPIGLSQAMLVDTETAEITPLLDAPMSDRSALSVAWSSDSHSVVVAGTFLPLDSKDSDEMARRRKSPVVVEVTVPSRSFIRIKDLPQDQYWRIRAGDSPNTFLVDASRFQEGDLRTTIPTLRFVRRANQWVQEQEASQSLGVRITVSEAIDRAPKLVTVDLTSHRESVLLDPNPQMRNYRFGRIEIMHWKGKRGESLTGGLTYPTNYIVGTRYPLVIQTHGFDEESFLPDGPFTTAFAAQELANKGIAVLQIGEGPLYDKSKGTPDFGPTNLSQLESAIDYLDGLGVIDRERVGLVGFSITGFQVRYALVHSKYPIAVATSAEGNDWGYWSYLVGANNPTWVSACEAPYGGPPWDGHWQDWMRDSISFNYEKLRTPLRLESDRNDSGFVLYEWENFIALKRLHKPVELIFVSHGDHPVVKPWDRVTSQQGNVDWLLFWLKGEEDPDPAKADQYARWHELQRLQEADAKASVTAQ